MVPNAAQSGASISQDPSDPGALSTVIAEVNSQIRNLVDNMLGGNQVPSGGSILYIQSILSISFTMIH